MAHSLAAYFATSARDLGHVPLVPRSRPAYRPGSPLRLGVVVPVCFVGGVERQLVGLLRELRRRPELGVHPSAIAYVGDRDPVPSIAAEFAGVASLVTERRWPGFDRTLVASSPAAAAGLVAASCDVCLVWSLHAPLLGEIRQRCARVVGISHGCGDWWMREADPFVDAWLAVSPAAAGPLPRAPWAIVPNGVELDRLDSDLTPAVARRRCGVPSGSTCVVYVGRFSREKRLDVAAAAMEHLPARYRLVLVGDGPCRPESSRTIVVPPTDRPGDVYRFAAASLTLSESEGFCLSAVESMAAGVPLVATPVGILPDVERQLEAPAYYRVPAEPTPADVAAAIVAATRAGASTVDRHAVRDLVRSEYSTAASAERWARMLRRL